MHTKVVKPPRWFARWRAAPRPQEEDPADVGTAFGLELSMLPVPADPSPAPPAERRAGWMLRRGDRRKNP